MAWQHVTFFTVKKCHWYICVNLHKKSKIICFILKQKYKIESVFDSVISDSL